MSTQISEDLWIDLALVCDDVREEAAKKLSLMGLYTADIVVESLPANVRVAFLFTVHCDKPGEWAVLIELKVGDADAASAVSNLSFDQAGVGNVILPQGFMSIESPTEFSISASANGGPKTEILRKKVQVGLIPR